MSEEKVEEVATEETELDQEVEQAEVDTEEAEKIPEAPDEDVVTIGDEAPPSEEVEHAQAPAWVKELRKNHKELQRKNRELEEKLKGAQPAEVKLEVGAKPKLEDHDYDSEAYEEELSKWYERKRVADDHAAKLKEKQAEEEKAWQGKLNAYAEAKTNLKVSDYEEAEITAQEVLSKTQQGIILQGSDNPALVVYALGKNPAKAKELAAINDPVKYAFAVAKLETQLKVTKRQAPKPEGTVAKGSAPISGSVDSTLERLRAEAAKTGNYTKVMQYKASKR